MEIKIQRWYPHTTITSVGTFFETQKEDLLTCVRKTLAKDRQSAQLIRAEITLGEGWRKGNATGT